jgi:hypothetical protein
MENKMNEAITLTFTPSEDFSKYDIELNLPESYRELPEAPAFLWDVAAVHHYLAQDENMELIIKEFQEYTATLSDEDAFDSAADVDVVEQET